MTRRAPLQHTNAVPEVQKRARVQREYTAASHELQRRMRAAEHENQQWRAQVLERLATQKEVDDALEAELNALDAVLATREKRRSTQATGQGEERGKQELAAESRNDTGEEHIRRARSGDVGGGKRNKWHTQAWEANAPRSDSRTRQRRRCCLQ